MTDQALAAIRFRSELTGDELDTLIRHFHSGQEHIECSHTALVRPCEEEAIAIAPVLAGIIAARLAP